MKYLPLILSGLGRRPVRSTLTVASIVTAFLLFGMLQGIDSGYRAIIAEQLLDRLFTDPRVPGGAPMPVAALDKIRALPEVTRVAGRSMLFGQYQHRRNHLVAIATDVEDFFAVRPELRMPAEQMAKVKQTRAGMAMHAKVAEELGVRIGDRVPLQSRVVRKDGGTVWDFEVVGLFTDPDDSVLITVVNYDYLNESRVNDVDTVDRIIVRIADPARSAQVAASIDRLFANSPHETRTQNEKEMTESSIQQIGDVAFFTRSVIGAVFFALLFVTGNTMAQSVRERIPEFAVLRTIGFSNAGIALLVFAESMVISVGAAAIGLLLAAAAFPLVRDLLGITTFSWIVVGGGIAVAVALALISALIPSWQLMRMKIVDALNA